MTIKVIKRGIPPNEWIYIVSCKTCLSVLEFNKRDTTVVSDYRDSGYKINCPVCSNDIFMSSLTKKINDIDPY